MSSKQPRAYARHALLSSTPGMIFALLLPKCPLCVAALLTTLGIGSAVAAELSLYAHSLAIAAVLAPLACCALLYLRATRKNKKPCQHCSPTTSQQPLSPRTSRSGNQLAQPQTSTS
jgi:hypothetical protein